MRNPSRTASTASALMIGLALITFVAILGAGLRSSYSDAVNKLFAGDYALTAENGFDPFTKNADAAVAKTPGVTAVSGIRGGDARVFGHNTQVTRSRRTSPDGPHRLGQWWYQRSGIARPGRGLRRQGLREGRAPHHRLADRCHDPDRRDPPPTPQGHLRSPEGGLAVRQRDDVGGDLRRQLLAAAEPDDVDQLKGGVSDTNTARLDASLAAFPDARIQTAGEFKKTQEDDINLH